MQPDNLLDPGGESCDEVQMPPEFVELTELRSISIDHKLGYFGEERFVIVGYSEEGQEVFWKDGCSSGFGLGHWQFFVEHLGPPAARRGIQLAGPGNPETHVAVVDRAYRCTYATCRSCAEGFWLAFTALRFPSDVACVRVRAPRFRPLIADRCGEASL